MASYGPPGIRLTDRGPQSMSKFFHAVFHGLCVQLRKSTPYHNRTNGQVERYNGTVVKQIRLSA